MEDSGLKFEKHPCMVLFFVDFQVYQATIFSFYLYDLVLSRLFIYFKLSNF